MRRFLNDEIGIRRLDMGVKDDIATLAATLPCVDGDPVEHFAAHDPGYLECVRIGGVTDADLRWFWGQPATIRAAWFTFSTIDRAHLYLNMLSSGEVRPEEARKRLWAAFPVYGDPREFSPPGLSGDSPIPWELKGRVDGEIKRRGGWTSTAGTFNAMVRAAVLAREI